MLPKKAVNSYKNHIKTLSLYTKKTCHFSGGKSTQILQLPIDRRLPHRHQDFVRLGKMPATEKAPRSRQRRRVRSGKDIMFGCIYKMLFLNSIITPKQEDESFALLRKPLDGTVGEGFPAVTLVRARLMRAHRKRSVEQQHALVRPRLQITASRRHKTHIRT